MYAAQNHSLAAPWHNKEDTSALRHFKRSHRSCLLACTIQCIRTHLRTVPVPGVPYLAAVGSSIVFNCSMTPQQQRSESRSESTSESSIRACVSFKPGWACMNMIWEQLGIHEAPSPPASDGYWGVSSPTVELKKKTTAHSFRPEACTSPKSIDRERNLKRVL